MKQKISTIALIVILYVQIGWAQQKKNVNDFDVIDLNSDGIISFTEFEKWYNANFNKAENNVKRLFVSYDLNSNGQLNVAEFVPLAFALSPKAKNKEDELFKRLDVNGDGILTQAEVITSKEKIAGEIINGLFQVADTDNNGQITYREYKLVTREGFNTPSNRLHKSAEQVGLVQSLMVSIDSNFDNYLTESEVAAFVKQFNQSGVDITKENIAQVFAKIDVNKDGLISQPELENQYGKIIRLVGVKPMPKV